MQVIDEETGRSDAEIALDNIELSQRAFRTYNDFCDRIDRIYSDSDDLKQNLGLIGLTDRSYDLFWSSIEVLKPAIYAKAPAVVVQPRYSDANPTDKMTSELMERVINSEFERGHINEEMLQVRDDLALMNRGVLWVTHDDEDGNAVCTEWLDREDFVHDTSRTWRDVGWVARRAWLTLDQMKKRFKGVSGDLWQRAFFGDRRDDAYNWGTDDSIPEKAAVWEIWDKTDGKVRWVTPGIDEYLEESEPHLNLDDFFPCPKPAYGTLIRRSLIPMPDYKRYAVHLDQINTLTKRIYDLLDRIRVMGFVAGGGDVGDAVQTALAQSDNSSAIIIPVPGAALTASGGAGNMISWLPLDVIANTITGMIDARAQLFADFDRLSGISDIMRGETEAQETLGAQRMKSQYGSDRVRDKKDELIRLSRDAARISSEIICENFTQDELLEIAQMDIPTRKEVEKSIKDIEKAARAEMEELTEGMGDQPPPEDPEQQAALQEQFQFAQKQIMEKYGPQLQQLEQTVVIEDVMELIRDQRGRSLIIDVETDSTVMTDEMAERQSRSEFMSGFSNALTVAQPLLAAGEEGAKLFGAMLKFSLEPFKISRSLSSIIDEFAENAPAMAAAMGEQEGGEGMEAMAEAQQKLSEAELQKAQAATMKVEADGQLKMFELQQKQQQAEVDAQKDAQKFELEIAQTQGKLDETNARIEKIFAEIQKMGIDTQLESRKVENSETETAADIGLRMADQARAETNDQIDRVTQARNRERDDEFRERGEQRADMQQQRGNNDDFQP